MILPKPAVVESARYGVDIVAALTFDMQNQLAVLTVCARRLQVPCGPSDQIYLNAVMQIGRLKTGDNSEGSSAYHRTADGTNGCIARYLLFEAAETCTSMVVDVP